MKRIILIMQVLVLVAIYFFHEIGIENLNTYRERFDYGILHYEFRKIREWGIPLFIYLVIWFIANLFKKTFGQNFLIWYSLFNLLPALLVIISSANILYKINEQIAKIKKIEYEDKTIILEYSDKKTLKKETHRVGHAVIREIHYHKNGVKAHAFGLDNQEDTLWYDSGQIKLIATSHSTINSSLYLDLTHPERLFSNVEYGNFHPIKFLAYWNEEGKQLLKNGYGEVFLYHPNGQLAIEHYFHNYMTTSINTFHLNGLKKTQIKYILPDFNNFTCEASEFKNLYTGKSKWSYRKKEFSDDGFQYTDDYKFTEITNLPLKGIGKIQFYHEDGTLDREIIMGKGQSVKTLTYHFGQKIESEIKFKVANKFKNPQVSVLRIQGLSSDEIVTFRQIEEWAEVQKDYSIEEKLTVIRYKTDDGIVYRENFK